jgi:protoheme IX farnesyltransferase
VRSSSAAGVARDLVALTKPRVISLLLVTAVVPMVVALDGWPPLALVLWTLLGGYLMAGGANAINMWFDRDLDGVMGRTRLRPLPAGRLAPPVALLYGALLGAIAFAVLALGANLLAACLALAGLVVYVLVYTVGLKRRSPQNIVLGGAAGAFPPLVGWAAAAGSVDVTAAILFAIVFYWTPPHFWALALVKRRDYASARVPMLPVVQGGAETRRQILLHSAILVPLTLLPAATGALGWVYAVAALLLGGRLVQLALRLPAAGEGGLPEDSRAGSAAAAGRSDDGTAAASGAGTAAAWRLYGFSLVYLALLFAAMLLDRALV